MAITLPNIILPPDTWVSVHSELTKLLGQPVTAANALSLMLLSQADVRINIGPTEPDATSGYRLMPYGDDIVNDPNDGIVWVMAVGTSALINAEPIDLVYSSYILPPTILTAPQLIGTPRVGSVVNFTPITYTADPTAVVTNRWDVVNSSLTVTRTLTADTFIPAADDVGQMLLLTQTVTVGTTVVTSSAQPIGIKPAL